MHSSSAFGVGRSVHGIATESHLGGRRSDREHQTGAAGHQPAAAGVRDRAAWVSRDAREPVFAVLELLSTSLQRPAGCIDS